MGPRPLKKVLNDPPCPIKAYLQLNSFCTDLYVFHGATNQSLIKLVLALYCCYVCVKRKTHESKINWISTLVHISSVFLCPYAQMMGCHKPSYNSFQYVATNLLCIVNGRVIDFVIMLLFIMNGLSTTNVT